MGRTTVWRPGLVAAVMLALAAVALILAPAAHAVPSGIYGQVTDADTGLPVSEAMVGTEYYDAGDDTYYWIEDETGTDGMYALTGDSVPGGLPAGDYQVSVDAWGYQWVGTDVTYDGSTAVQQDFQIVPSVLGVFGHISDADTGDPIEYPDVWAEYYDAEDDAWYYTGYGDSDDNGDYELYDVAVGDLTVYFGAYGYEYDSQDITFDGVNAVECNGQVIVADPVVSGAVTDAETGDTLWDAEVWYEYYDAGTDSFYSDWAWLGEDGEYVFYDFPVDADVTVVASCEAYEDSETIVNYDGVTPERRDFELIPADPVIYGQVTDAETGEAIPWPDISYAWYSGDDGDFGWPQTEEDGSYTIYGVPAGVEVTISVSAYAYEDAEAVVTYDGDPVEKDFALTPATPVITGHVSDADDGSDLPETWVFAEYYDDAEDEWYWAADGWTDESGDYALYGLEAGDYRLTAEAYGYIESSADVTYDGTNALVQDFELDPAPVAFFGEVTDAENSDPLEGAWVLATYHDEIADSWFEEYTWTDEAGEYVLYGPAPLADIDLSVEMFGYEETTEAVSHLGLPVEKDFALTPHPEAFTGTVTDASTEAPLAGASVYAQVWDEEWDDWNTLGGVSTYADGSYTIRLGDADDYRIFAAKDGFDEDSAELTFDGSDAVTHDFVLAPTGWEPEDPGDLPYTPVKVEGTDRFGTAIASSKAAFPDGAPVVVIATGMNWPDALGGASLAAAEGGPILLTKPGELPGAVLSEIRRLDAEDAIVLGSESAVGKPVFDALAKELGKANVRRIGGSDRYVTADLVAKATVDALGDAYDGTCFVGTGGNFPDALGASPLAAAKGWPIFLSAPAGVKSSTAKAMDAVGVQEVLILGSDKVVSKATENALKADYTVRRLYGADRYATARAVATYGVANADLEWDKVALATGENFPDALAGGVLQGKDGSVMLLTTGKSLHAAPKKALTDNKAMIQTVRYLGSTNAVGKAVRDQVAAILK